MENYNIFTRAGLSGDMQVLLRDYPRYSWPGHANFADSIKNWMGAHDMFRRLGEIMRIETEKYLNKDRSSQEYSARLSHYGNMLVGNLHGHHTWEDRKFFPELRAADGRFDRGIDILEHDHETLDETLNELTLQANRVIKLVDLEEKQAIEEAGPMQETIARIEKILKRHLADEEDLVVPILLHHKLRG